MEEKIKILYAEDDKVSALVYSELIEAAGFYVRVAENGDVAWDLYRKYPWDLLLLDMDLPGKNGYDLIHLVRQSGDKTPIVILSSLNHCNALYEGADDYLIKGGSIDDIKARLHKAIERAKFMNTGKNPDLFILSSSTTFNFSNGRLTINGREKKLKTTESFVLQLLCLRVNELLLKEELCNSIWGIHSVVKERELTRYISGLRKYFVSDSTVLIESDFGKGYRLVTNLNNPMKV